MYSDKIQSAINTQSATLDKLRRDNEFLTQELKLLELQAADEVKSGAGSEKAEALKEQIGITFKYLLPCLRRGRLMYVCMICLAFVEKKIRESTNDSSQLDKRLSESEKLYAKKRAAAGFNPKAPGEGRRNIDAMAGRLDKTLVRYNKTMEGNDKLREEIDALRCERIAFNNVYKRYERELQDRKKQMNDIIQSSTVAYEIREETQNRMIALKERAEKEHQVFLQELKELERQIEQDKKLRDFMLTKGVERYDSAIKAKNGAGDASGKRGSVDILYQLEEFNQDLTLLAKDGSADVNGLVQDFQKVEAENFSLFNYVNELNNQINFLSSELETVHQRVRRDSDKIENIQKQQHDKVNKIDDEIQSMQAKREKYEIQANHLTQTIETVNKDLDNIFNMLNLQQSLASMEELPAHVVSLNDKETVLLKKLRAVELKTNDLLMKNLLSTLPKKFTSAAIASPDSEVGAEGEKSEVSRDPAFIASVVQTLREGNEDPDNVGVKINSLYGTGPNAPVLTVRADNSMLSPSIDADEEEALDEDQEFPEFQLRPLSRSELSPVTEKIIARRLSERKPDLDGLIKPSSSRSRKSNGSRSKISASLSRKLKK